MIDAFATQPQYVEHLAPVWRALPDELRGTFMAAGTAGRRATELGVRLGGWHGERGAEAPLTLVASFQDEQHVRPRPVVLVEHGAGQSYFHDSVAEHNPSYPGGRSREGVCLFICPNESVAQRWRDMYPDTPTAVVGCPFLDPWHQTIRVATPTWKVSQQVAKLNPGAGILPLVVFAFHWDCHVVPECRNALSHYKEELQRLARMTDEERGWQMGGHAHPRAHEIMAWWRGLGVRTFNHFSEVLDYADCFVADNTSCLFEFASTDRPVVVLNAPWYRRDIDHGLRFWSGANVGVQCDEPWQVQSAVELSLGDDVGLQMDRRRIVKEVYAYTDGLASQRAAAAITAVYEEGHWRAWREKRNTHNPFDAHGSPALDGTRAEIVRVLREMGLPLESKLAERLAGATEEDLQRILASLARPRVARAQRKER